jgi:hypothetical protein
MPRRPPALLLGVAAATALAVAGAAAASSSSAASLDAATTGRSLLIADSDPGVSRAFPIAPGYAFNQDIPLTDKRLLKPGGPGCDAGPDGLRLSHWGPGAVLVSFSTCDPATFAPAPGRPATDGPSPDSRPPPPPPALKAGEWAVEVYSAAGRLVERVPVDPRHTTSYESHFPDRQNGNSYAGGYRSGRISHALVSGLNPGGNYAYRVVLRRRKDGAAWAAKSPLLAFEAPWAATSLDRAASKGGGRFYRVAFVGDPGQTPDTARTISALAASRPRHVVILGDICYADEFLASGQPLAGGSVPREQWYSAPGGEEQTFEPKWDTSARLWSPVARGTPILSTPGNHDFRGTNKTLDPKLFDAYFIAYNARYPAPNGGGVFSLAPAAGKLPPPTAAPPMFPPSQLDAIPASLDEAQPAVGANTNLFYSTELPGATMIFITPYIPSAFGPGTAQYVFLEETLKRVDRKRTPWVIVSTHSNLYSTFVGHFKEMDCFREAYEPLLLKYGVDLLLNGHVHAYERTHPVADYKADPCGVVHISVGDAGNIEGLDGMTGIEENADPATQGGYNWRCDRFEERPAPFPGAGGKKLNCPSLQPELSTSGGFCFTKLPSWVAFRRPSFGFGTLDIYNATTARWTWIANTKQGATDAPAGAPLRDGVWLRRGPAADKKAGCVRAAP